MQTVSRTAPGSLGELGSTLQESRSRLLSSRPSPCLRENREEASLLLQRGKKRQVDEAYKAGIEKMNTGGILRKS
jgi:hypothetical protein